MFEFFAGPTGALLIAANPGKRIAGCGIGEGGLWWCQLAMTMFELFTGSARTGRIAANMGPGAGVIGVNAAAVGCLL